MRPAPARVLPVVPVVLLVASCVSGPPPVGDAGADRAPLSSTPALAHLARAVEGGATATVADLFREDVVVATAPDPGALLDATWAAATPARAGAVPLSIVTWNVALLDTRATPPLPRFHG